jgi:hypothetical protein
VSFCTPSMNSFHSLAAFDFMCLTCRRTVFTATRRSFRQRPQPDYPVRA